MQTGPLKAGAEQAASIAGPFGRVFLNRETSMKFFVHISVIVAVAVALLGTSLDSEARSGKASTGTGAKGSSTHVRGYVTKKGTYVAPHRRTTPDKTKTNNYSTKGNVNLVTGKRGTK